MNLAEKIRHGVLQLERWLKDTNRISSACNEAAKKAFEIFGPKPRGRPRGYARMHPEEVIAFYKEQYKKTGSSKEATYSTAEYFSQYFEAVDERTIWRILEENKNLP